MRGICFVDRSLEIEMSDQPGTHLQSMLRQRFIAASSTSLAGAVVAGPAAAGSLPDLPIGSARTTAFALIVVT
jgi:hypothetical protein